MASFLQSSVNGQLVAVPTAAIAGGLPYAFVKAAHNMDIVEKDVTTGMPLVNVEGAALNKATGEVVLGATTSKPMKLNGVEGTEAVTIAKRLPQLTQELAKQQALALKAKLSLPAVAKARAEA